MLSNKRKVTAIILVAGNSTRFGKNINKNFEKINGKTILSYSLNAFDKNKYIDDLIIAIREKEKENVQEIILQEHMSKNAKIVVGGNKRSESVYNCIKSADADIVIIQDGARLLIKKDNYEIKIIDGDYTNIKITTFEDLDIAQKFIK